jgi:hypothetical protein
MMVNEFGHPTDDRPDPAELSRDRKLEVLLDEMVSSSPSLPAGFASRVASARPFAPWEVRRASSWKAPAAVLAGLFLSSVGLFLAPLGNLGPATALAVWGNVVTAAFAQPAGAILTAGPALASAVEAIRHAVSPAVALAFGGGAAAAALLTAVVLRRRPARAAR